jgi:hypothetical protein
MPKQMIDQYNSRQEGRQAGRPSALQRRPQPGDIGVDRLDLIVLAVATVAVIICLINRLPCSAALFLTAGMGFFILREIYRR